MGRGGFLTIASSQDEGTSLVQLPEKFGVLAGRSFNQLRGPFIPFARAGVRGVELARDLIDHVPRLSGFLTLAVAVGEHQVAVVFGVASYGRLTALALVTVPDLEYDYVRNFGFHGLAGEFEEDVLSVVHATLIVQTLREVAPHALVVGTIHKVDSFKVVIIFVVDHHCKNSWIESEDIFHSRLGVGRKGYVDVLRACPEFVVRVKGLADFVIDMVSVLTVAMISRLDKDPQLFSPLGLFGNCFGLFARGGAKVLVFGILVDY